MQTTYPTRMDDSIPGSKGGWNVNLAILSPCADNGICGVISVALGQQ
jgi:hypothetical protein